MPSIPDQQFPDYYKDLMRRYLDGQCTAGEAEDLFAWLGSDDSRRFLLLTLQKEFDLAMASPGTVPLSVSKRIQDRLFKNLGPVIKRPVRQLLYKYRGWVAAASVLSLIVALYALRLHGPGSVKAMIPSPDYAKEVAPGGDRATLRLADGSTIVLDSAEAGKLAQQGGTGVIKVASGKLAYQTITSDKLLAATQVTYNTLTTPRGGQYQVVLADGSRVWLNAGSSLEFPTAFTGKERRVKLTGEGYFEVAGNPINPFRVMVGDMTVDVLGTHFNIMAYGDEQDLTTTLLEGAVKVNAGPGASLLRPGQAAMLDRTTRAIQVEAVDVDEVTAWKNGLFQFTNADLPAVMRQLSRWYDVDVSYEGKQRSYEFVGRITRSSNLSSVLKVLEINGVRFRMEGKKLIVTND